MIMSGAEPFFLPGGPVGCLLVHGFTGTPNEMRWLGEFLNEKGYSVLGIRLAGHGTRVADMSRMRWRDWLASVEDGYDLLSGSSQKIVVMGLSLGGILSLTFASGRFTPGCPVAGVVAMAVPHKLPANPHLLRAAKALSLVKPYMPKGISDWYDHEAEQEQLCYEVDPVRAGAEVRDVLVEMKSSLSLIRVPALLIYSKNDQTVRPEEQHAEKIYQKIGSERKSLVWIEHSGHVITRDLQRLQVFQIIADFLAEESIQPA